jgi:hypothetical protein
MKLRRLVVRDVNGESLMNRDGREHWQIDLTGIPNANSRATLTAVIQEQCNLGCWHDTQTLTLPPWGAD